MDFFVDVAGLCLGVDDLLRPVQAVPSGKHVAGGNGYKVVRHSFKSEQLKRNKQGSDGAVCDAAEHTCHAAGGSKGRGKSENR